MDGEFEAADELRKTLIPDKICKFVSLSETDESSNDKRLETLKSKSVWVSDAQSMNDPYEFKSVYFDQEKAIAEGNWAPKTCETISSKLASAPKEYLKFASFSELSAKQNLAMWAHYANKHRGICVVYRVLNPTHLYPVVYSQKPIDATCQFLELYNELINEILNQTAPPVNIPKAMRATYLQILTKEKSWSYEKEIRLFDNSKEARNIPLESVGLQTACVIAGSECSTENVNQLKEICYTNLNCPLEKAFLSRKEFLEFRKVQLVDR